MSTTMSNNKVSYEDRVLVQRAIRVARPDNGSRSLSRWTLVKNLFGTSQPVARAICCKYGFDPDKVVRPIYPLPDDEGAR